MLSDAKTQDVLHLLNRSLTTSSSSQMKISRCIAANTAKKNIHAKKVSFSYTVKISWGIEFIFNSSAYFIFCLIRLQCQKILSSTVSRVMSAHTRMMIIYLILLSPADSSDLPKSTTGSRIAFCLVLLRMGFTEPCLLPAMR